MELGGGAFVKVGGLQFKELAGVCSGCDKPWSRLSCIDSKANVLHTSIVKLFLINLKLSENFAKRCPQILRVDNIFRNRLPAHWQNVSIVLDDLDSIVVLGVVTGSDHQSRRSMKLGSDRAENAHSEAETLHVAAQGAEAGGAIGELDGVSIVILDHRKFRIEFNKLINW